MANEKRLIDANAFFDKLEKLAELMRQGKIGEIDLNLLIASMPTVDAVKVIRCKDCKCAYINSFSAASGVAVCKKWSNEAEAAIVQQDDFCSYGERRAEDG